MAEEILADPRLEKIERQAEDVIRTGLNAGNRYPEIWIRDLSTFVDLALHVRSREEIRTALLRFFYFQGEDGGIVDGYALADESKDPYSYILSPEMPGYVAHKNTVEADQESSLVIAIAKYLRVTGDESLLAEKTGNIEVSKRIELALEFLLKHRFSERHGLLWSGTTADWGDIQPEHSWGVELNEDSHPAISIYTNAMFCLAVESLLALPGFPSGSKERWAATLVDFRQRIRAVLWDEKAMKFIPHVYLKGSPFPPDFDESVLYFQGGTAVAANAGILTRAEVLASYQRMSRNREESRARSIGVSIWPPYPAGLFQSPSMGPGSYQNGGDWTWFGGRMVHALVRYDFGFQAWEALSPMLDMVLDAGDFYEWHQTDGTPRGAYPYRGAAGVLWSAIQDIRTWSRKQAAESPLRA